MQANITGIIFDGLENETLKKQQAAKAARTATRQRIQHPEPQEEATKEPKLSEKYAYIDIFLLFLLFTLPRERKQKERNLKNYNTIIKRYPKLKARLDECAMYESGQKVQSIIEKVVRYYILFLMFTLTHPYIDRRRY
jgi:hypothetical protein